MKRILSLILVVVMCISIAACKSEDSEGTGPNGQTEPTGQTEPFEPSEQQLLIINTVNAYLATDNYNGLVQNYEIMSSIPGREPKAVHAMEYSLADYNGFSAHFMLIKLEADLLVTEDEYYSSVCILVDMDSGASYDNISADVNGWKQNDDGIVQSKSDVIFQCLWSYEEYTNGRQSNLLDQAESRIVFTADDLAYINDSLTK